MTKYFEPKTVEQAVQALAEAGAGARLLAGGTDLIVGVNNGLRERPPALVSLRRIDGLRSLEVGASEVVIGAATTLGDVLFSAELQEKIPALAEVAGKIACSQIRNLGTVGGNLCNASPAADMVNPLIALGASVELARWEGGAKQARAVALEDFFVGPGQTVCRAGELLTTIRIPVPPPGFRYALEKFGRRPSMEIAVIAVGVGAVVDGQGALTDVRVVYGALAPTPRRGPKAEAALEGRELTEDAIRAAVAAAQQEVQPISDLRGSAVFRRELAGVLTRRAAERVARPAAAAPVRVWPTRGADRICGRSAGPQGEPRAADGGKSHPISFTLNGAPARVEVGPLTSLIDALRGPLGLQGTKHGCGEGECGTCTVIVDGEAVNACIQLAIDCHGREVVTIEGLKRDGELDRIQRAFVEHGAVQCGFCTPGMILQAWWLLHHDMPLTEELAKRAIEGNLCRCTGYVKIVEAILALAESGAEDRVSAG
ncbi:MAG: FAD binding domain-containing protein [bacterium]